MKVSQIGIAVVMLGFSAWGLADDRSGRALDVQFMDCREYVGFGPIDLAKAQAALPPGFTATETGGSGGLVVRASACESVSVDGSKPQKAIVAHYGINVVSPDGTGDINNYTLTYVTSSKRLAKRLTQIGLPAIYNAEIAVEDPPQRPGSAYISVFGDGLIPYSLSGTVNDPTPVQFPFLANWWFLGSRGAIKMATNIPQIAFGPAQLILQTTSASALGKLIGGNTDSNFPWYNVRGSFEAGDMAVTVNK